MLKAVREAWAKVASPDQCEKSAESVGYSINPEELELFFAKSRVTPNEVAATYRQFLNKKKQRNYYN
jgi:hypothetical protein